MSVNRRRVRGVMKSPLDLERSRLSVHILGSQSQCYGPSLEYCECVWCKFIRKWPINTPNNNEHITLLLMELHWLSIPVRIQFKLSVLVFRCLHGTAPPYLADQPVAAFFGVTRRRLRSLEIPRLDFPRVRRTTIGDRAFCVAGPHMCMEQFVVIDTEFTFVACI